jgi:hypothetical protein
LLRAILPDRFRNADFGFAQAPRGRAHATRRPGGATSATIRAIVATLRKFCGPRWLDGIVRSKTDSIPADATGRITALVEGILAQKGAEHRVEPDTFLTEAGLTSLPRGLVGAGPG